MISYTYTHTCRFILPLTSHIANLTPYHLPLATHHSFGVDLGISPEASRVFSAGGLGQEAGSLWPPLAVPGPMAGKRAWRCYSALGSGFDNRH